MPLSRDAWPGDPVAADREGRLYAVKESGRHGSALARLKAGPALPADGMDAPWLRAD